MNTKSQFHDHSHSQPQINVEGKAEHTKELTGAAMDRSQRDRFELLSAYLDGELTAKERKQVEVWLAEDPGVQSLYGRLLKLRQGLRDLPVPETQTPEKTIQQVFARLQRRRLRLALLGGGAAVAACAIATLSSLLPGEEMRMPQMANRYSPSGEVANRSVNLPPTENAVTPATIAPPSPLMVAINEPVFQIPKAAESSEINRSQQNKTKDRDFNREIN